MQYAARNFRPPRAWLSSSYGFAWVIDRKDQQANDGYVTAQGTWTPDGLIDNADVEIECVRTPIHQLSHSKIGVCKMAAGSLFHGIAAVSMNDFGIVAWERTKIIAEHDSPLRDCENQQLVLDFRFNTVTLTSTLSRAPGSCAEMMHRIDKSRKEQHKPALKDAEVFILVHYFGSPYADEDGNPFFNKKQSR